jgi:hypothetical protein
MKNTSSAGQEHLLIIILLVPFSFVFLSFFSVILES